MVNCLNCGNPLGGQVALCYSCQNNDVDLPDVDADVLDRLERYCLVASVRCSDCGDIHGEVHHDGDVYTGETFGIESEEEWHLEMEKEEDWIKDNVEQVQRALLEIEDEWPQTVAAIRMTHL